MVLRAATLYRARAVISPISSLSSSLRRQGAPCGRIGALSIAATRQCAQARRHGTAQSIKADDETIKAFKDVLSFPPSTCSLLELSSRPDQWLGKEIVLHGYLGSRRNASKTLTFAELHDPSLRKILQLVESQAEETPSTHSLRSLDEHIPVAVTGVLQARRNAKSSAGALITEAELQLQRILPLNGFDKDVIMTSDTAFSPDQRHLQIRSDAPLRHALKFRSDVTNLIRDELCRVQSFTEIETPLLFKSTPEGAREFLVPTRMPGLAYALPQSPQQYKQVLMAAAVPKYMQIAKCFRDEDLRADRQPEFTQVDIEQAFAGSEEVMTTIENLVHRLWRTLLPDASIQTPFARMTYDEAMSKYGSDKPDVRIGIEIHSVDDLLPRDLISKISDLSDPIVDVFKIGLSGNPRETASFVRRFMESPEARPFMTNPAGQPGIFIVDPSKPLRGMQPLGFEAAEKLEEILDISDGDCIIAQARANEPFSGGYTMAGNLRLALHNFAVSQKLIPPPTGFAFTWVIDFPLFTPSSESEPGQGGSAGLSSTHHPFTSPKTAADVDALFTNPRDARADHYDLVVNGVELGGGSRRIHDAAMQEFVMRQVLGMSEERIADFTHLLSALRAGCPPHAGIALGLDRLVAVMLGYDSVRDVIAFPKNGKGEDMMVKSPSYMSCEQLSTYHLRLQDRP